MWWKEKVMQLPDHGRHHKQWNGCCLEHLYRQEKAGLAAFLLFEGQSGMHIYKVDIKIQSKNIRTSIFERVKPITSLKFPTHTACVSTSDSWSHPTFFSQNPTSQHLPLSLHQNTVAPHLGWKQNSNFINTKHLNNPFLIDSQNLYDIIF